MTEPLAKPTGVYVRHADGVEIACELTYVGVSPLGANTWKAKPVDGSTFDLDGGDELRVASWPPHAAITVYEADDA